MSDGSHRLIIRTAAQARRRRLMVVIAVATLLVGGWGIYWLGRLHAPTAIERQVASQQKIESDRKLLLAEKRRLETENRKLSERNVMLERGADVDQQAISALQNSLDDVQAQVAKLKKELAFYRGIVSPSEAEAGLRLQELQVHEASEAGVYQFQLVLIQAVEHDSAVSGQVKLRLEGLQNGESVSLTWPELALDSADELVFSFKYFQELADTFRLPPDFEPTLVEVVVNTGPGAEPVTGSFRWREVFKPDD
ncbi:hypothetical protein RM531_14965 [Salinisphaera sp. P385]|uniref:MSHA biogenesis protein MshJ n=1 Tax=Spectribacter acetivorans TaxID=3075603 RepID=A0ABU3BBB7_9GAMM|nr:DUF6776 family protein [Salinisphaera sp. P385]MDT0619777.1 hypothetical protein [Salinisphaera sp. P385]